MHKERADNMGTLYENIKSACDEKGITVSKLCVDLGYSKSNMTNLKKGQATMNSERLARFASYLGVTVDELISQNTKIDPAENEVDLQNEFEIVTSNAQERSCRTFTPMYFSVDSALTWPRTP